MMKKSLPIVVLILSLLLAGGAMAYAAPDPSYPPTGGADAIVDLDDNDGDATTPRAGVRNTTLIAFTIEDDGAQTAGTSIEYICVQKTTASTLPDQYVYQLKLFHDDGGDGAYDEWTDQLIGIIRRPDFDDDFDDDGDADGACFGRPGILLWEVVDNTTENFIVTMDLRSTAPDQLSITAVVTPVPSDSLLGQADVSNSFISGKDFAVGDPRIIRNATGEADAQVLAEPNDVEVELGSGAQDVVLGQFQIEDSGAKYDEEEHATYLQHITLFLTGYRGGSVDNSVLEGIQSISIYKDTAATPPGFGRGDRRIWRLTRPTLRSEFVTLDSTEKLELVAGYRGRRIMRIPSGMIERIYVVADLGSEFQDGDRIELEILPGAMNGSTGSRFSLAPGETVPAYNPTYIVLPSPTLVIHDAIVSSTGKLVISVDNIPAPGLETLTGTLSYDPLVADAYPDPVWFFPEVNVLNGNYEVVTGLDPDTMLVNFTVALRPGREALTGDGDLFELTFEAWGEPGDTTTVTIDPWATLLFEANGGDFELDVDPGTITVRLIKGDVNGDGIVTRGDARDVALFIIGRSTLSWSITRQRQADVAAPFCDPDFLVDGATSAPACIDISDARIIMLMAYGLVSLESSISALAAQQPLQVSAIALTEGAGGFTLAANGQGIASTQLQLYNLAGNLVLDKEAMGNTLQFRAMNEWGEALANGVYLYVVTVRGFDGAVIKSEIRKLVILK